MRTTPSSTIAAFAPKNSATSLCCCRRGQPTPAIFCLLRLIRLLSALSIFACLLVAPFAAAAAQDSPFAQGNLFVIFNPKSGRSSENNPQVANLSALWCQATSTGNDRLRIKEANFVRVLPKPETVIPASKYNAARDRAFLQFGVVPISSVGKYRCQIHTEDGEFVTGNLFVFMRPVLVVDSQMRLDPVEENNLFAWIGASNKARAGDDAQLNCPVMGYPLPEIRWFKDGQPINTSAILPGKGDDADGDNGGGTSAMDRKYLLTAQSLYVRQVEDQDEGTYKCVATNEFPLHADAGEKKRQFQLSLEQHLRVTTSLSWLLPLLIIVVCLLLLVLIIWGCSQWKRYKYEQYNVAQKEREMGKRDGAVDGQQKLPLEPDDLED